MQDFETSAPNDPKMTLNITRQEVCVTNVPNFQIPGRFWPTVHFEKCTKWPIKGLESYEVKSHQNDIEPYSQMYPIYVLLVSLIPKFQSVSLYGQLFLKLQAILRKSALNDLKMTLNPTPSNVHHVCITRYPQVQTFTPFWSMTRRFQHGPFWDKCTKQPQIHLEAYKLKYTLYMHYMYQYPPVSNSLFCSTTTHF